MQSVIVIIIKEIYANEDAARENATVFTRRERLPVMPCVGMNIRLGNHLEEIVLISLTPCSVMTESPRIAVFIESGTYDNLENATEIMIANGWKGITPSDSE